MINSIYDKFYLFKVAIFNFLIDCQSQKMIDNWPLTIYFYWWSNKLKYFHKKFFMIYHIKYFTIYHCEIYYEKTDQKINEI
jgi:hypothetical protein